MVGMGSPLPQHHAGPAHPTLSSSCPQGSDVAVAISEDQLPLTLPDTDNFKPSGSPESPLAAITDWINTTDSSSGKPARR